MPGCLFTMGDLIAQTVVERHSTIDLKRTLRMATFGTFITV
jgi:hypothetical protein